MTSELALSHESTVHEEDPFLASDNNEAQIMALARSIKMQRGFGLYFVCINQSEHRRNVLNDLRRHLSAFNLTEVFLRETVEHPLRYLEEVVPGLPLAPDARPRSVICVYGMENWLGGVEVVENSAFVADLNATRNAFPSALGCPLLLCVPEHILVGIMRGAPDFFSVRSGLYFLDTPPYNRVLPTVDAMSSTDLDSALGAGIERRRLQAAEWEEILNGYRALPPERRDQLAEARALENMATIHAAEGKHDLAISLLRRALDIKEALLDANHPSIAVTLGNLAFGYNSVHDFVRAMPLSKRALAISEDNFGVGHGRTAPNLNNLARIYQELGDMANALLLFERALAVNEATLGPDDAQTASSLNNLATVYADSGNFDRALPLLERALSISEVALGENHPSTALSLNNLASLHLRKGDYASALPLFERATAIDAALLGAEHPTTAAIVANLEAARQAASINSQAYDKPKNGNQIWKGSIFDSHGRVGLTKSSRRKKRR